MDGPILARLGAVVFVVIVITATVVEMKRKKPQPATVAARAVEAVRDPLREGLRRCQQLGEAAANHAECLRLWAQSRDRFLGRTGDAGGSQSDEGR